MGTNAYYLNQFISTTLATVGGIDDSQTTGIILTSVTGVETTKPGIVCLSYSDPIDTSKAEWISYTSISVTNELQGVTRGAEGFSAKSHSNGVTIAFPISESHINNLNDALIIGGSATNLATGVIDDDTFATASATKLATSESIKAYVDSGWSNANQTWTREGDNSFSEPIDATLKYQKGDKIRYKQGGGWKYQYIISVGAYSGGKTIMTTTGGSDFKFDSGTAITDNYYSKASSPQGFPAYFTYTPIWTQTTTNPTLNNGTLAGIFSITGSLCNFYLNLTIGSTTSMGVGAFILTVPVISANTDIEQANIAGIIRDAGTSWFRVTSTVLNNSNQMTKIVGYDQLNSCSQTVPMTWASTDFMLLGGSYII